MTVGITTPRKEYVEDGVTTFHSVPFQFFDPDELVVSRIDGTSDANAQLLVLNVDYTVAGGAGDVGSITKATGGELGATLRIDRHTHRSQLLDYSPTDDFPAEMHEQGLDRLEMQVQELDMNQLDAEAVRDIIGQTLVAGPGIAIDVNDALNTVTISLADLANIPDMLELSGDQQTNAGGGGGGGGSGLTSEDVEDIVASMLTAGDGIRLTYDDPGNKLTIENTDPASTSGQLTTVQVQAIVGAMILGATGITVNYDPSTEKVTIEDPEANSGATGLLSVTQQSLAANGYCTLSNGLKLNWGSVSVPGDTTPTIFYPSSYTSFSVCVGSGGVNDTGGSATVRVISCSDTGFTVCNNAGSAVEFFWIAIGV